VLHKLLMWALDEEGKAEQRDDHSDRRSEGRIDFSRARVPIRSRRTQSTFHLKDMSRLGACGISDMPLAVGAVIFIRLAKGRYQAAEVRWVRNAQVGLRFFRPIQRAELDRLRRLREEPGGKPAANSLGPVFTRR
jgi:hypothetical protein